MAEDGGAAEIVALADEALPLFAAARDDRGAGRALLLRGAAVGAVRGRNLEWLECGEQAAERYRRAGWPASWCFGAIAAALVHGPTPVPEGIARCEAMLAETEPGTHGHAEVTMFLASLTAMAARFDEGRRLQEDAEQALRELGLLRELAHSAAGVRASIHRLEGGLGDAAAVLEQSCAELDRLGDRHWAATRRASLASILVSLGDRGAAEEVARRAAQDGAADDLPTQYLWRAALARAIATDRPAEALTIVEEALRLVRSTDALNQQAEVALAAAEVDEALGRGDAAQSHVRRAIRLLDRKGNVAAAAEVRSPRQASLIT
jgi:tetratricopeptide (TPR) repeat protein